MEKLSKSLQDGRKLAVAESYQDLSPAAEEDHVKYRHTDKHSSRLKQRPKSLNFEIFFDEFEEGENKIDNEKIGHTSGEYNKEIGQIVNFEMMSKSLPREEKE